MRTILEYMLAFALFEVELIEMAVSTLISSDLLILFGRDMNRYTTDHALFRTELSRVFVEALIALSPNAADLLSPTSTSRAIPYLSRAVVYGNQVCARPACFNHLGPLWNKAFCNISENSCPASSKLAQRSSTVFVR